MSEIRQYIGARYVMKVYENSLDHSSAEWEASTAYEPLTMVTYNNSSYLSKKDVPNTVGDPAANPDYWVVTGSYNGQIAHLQDEIDALKDAIVTPEMFGAIGDGTSDDSQAIQDAFDFGKEIILNNTYKVTKTLFIDGNKKISGSGTILAYLPEIDPDEYIIVFGASSMGVAGNVFTGVVENITIEAHSGNYNYGLGFCNADNVVVKNVSFDFSAADCHNKILFFGPNAVVTPEQCSSNYYTVEDCVFISDNNPGSSKNQCESISFENKDHINISNNTILYCKDDGIGLHNCSHIEVRGNYLHAYSGRILGSYIEDAAIVDNKIFAEPNIATQGIQIEYEPRAILINKINRNIRICNNVVDYTGTTTTVTQYGIRVHGTKDSVISGNVLITGTGDQARIAIENQPVTTQTPTPIQSEGNEICDNICSDIFYVVAPFSTSDTMKPNNIHDNIIGRRLNLNSIYNISHNNILDNASPDAYTLDGYLVNMHDVQPNMFGVLDLPVTNAAQYMKINGFNKYRVAGKGYISNAIIANTAPYTALPSGSSYVFEVIKNGVTIGSKQIDDVTAYGTLDIINIPVADRWCVDGDSIVFTVKVNGTLPGTLPTQILFGMNLISLRNC